MFKAATGVNSLAITEAKVDAEIIKRAIGVINKQRQSAVRPTAPTGLASYSTCNFNSLLLYRYLTPEQQKIMSSFSARGYQEISDSSILVKEDTVEIQITARYSRKISYTVIVPLADFIDFANGKIDPAVAGAGREEKAVTPTPCS